jgi:hypothetical protein
MCAPGCGTTPTWSRRTTSSPLHRRHHDGHRRSPDLFDGGARVGTRHHGAAHLDAGQRSGIDPRQAAALLRHRHARRPAGRAHGGVYVSRAAARQRGVPVRPGRHLPGGGPGAGPAGQHRHQKPVAREPAGHGTDVSGDLPAVGLYVCDQQHADCYPADHLRDPGAIFRDVAQGHLPEGRGAGILALEAGLLAVFGTAMVALANLLFTKKVA